MPFALLMLGVIAGGMCALLALNTATAASEVRERKIDAANATLNANEEQLSRAVAAMQAPGQLALMATRLGLVPAGSPAFLRINDNGTVTVLGHPGAIVAPPKALTAAQQKALAAREEVALAAAKAALAAKTQAATAKAAQAKAARTSGPPPPTKTPPPSTTPSQSSPKSQTPRAPTTSGPTTSGPTTSGPSTSGPITTAPAPVPTVTVGKGPR